MALLDERGYAFDNRVLFVFVGVVVAFEVHAEQSPEALPESGAKRAEKGFEYVVACLVGLASDEFNQRFGLIFSEFFQDRFVLLEYIAFHLFEVPLPFLLGGECGDVFVCFD